MKRLRLSLQSVKIYNETDRLYKFNKKIRAKTFNIVDIQSVRRKNIQNIRQSIQDFRESFRKNLIDEACCRKTFKKIICFAEIEIVEHETHNRETSKTIFQSVKCLVKLNVKRSCSSEVKRNIIIFEI